MRRALILATSVLAMAPGVAVAQEPERTSRPTPVAAFGDVRVWSEVAGPRRFALTARVGAAAPERLRTAERSVPFDVDLGPDAEGRTVAVYSRCAREAEGSGSFLPHDYDQGAGCDLWRYDLATGTERRIAGASTAAADETWPTIWRDTVAFVRSYDAKPDLPYLYTRRAGERSVRQPGGPRQVCAGGSCTDRRVARPYALELAGTRLAFGWAYAGFSEGLDTEIRLDTIGGGNRVVTHQDGGGLTGRALGWPAIEAGRVFFTRACYADASGCVGRAELGRHRISTGTTDAARGPRAVVAHERAGGRTLALVDTASGTDCLGDPPVPGGTCELRSLEPMFSETFR